MSERKKLVWVGLGKMDRHRRSRFCERKISRLRAGIGAEGLDAIPGGTRQFVLGMKTALGWLYVPKGLRTDRSQLITSRSNRGLE